MEDEYSLEGLVCLGVPARGGEDVISPMGMEVEYLKAAPEELGEREGLIFCPYCPAGKVSFPYMS